MIQFSFYQNLKLLVLSLIIIMVLFLSGCRNRNEIIKDQDGEVTTHWVFADKGTKCVSIKSILFNDTVLHSFILK